MFAAISNTCIFHIYLGTVARRIQSLMSSANRLHLQVVYAANHYGFHSTDRHPMSCLHMFTDQALPSSLNTTPEVYGIGFVCVRPSEPNSSRVAQ